MHKICCVIEVSILGLLVIWSIAFIASSLCRLIIKGWFTIYIHCFLVVQKWQLVSKPHMLPFLYRHKCMKSNAYCMFCNIKILYYCIIVIFYLFFIEDGKYFMDCGVLFWSLMLHSAY